MTEQDAIHLRVNAEHRLEQATWSPSPHWDERPEWAELELIVVHCISLPEGQFGTGLPQALFLGTLDITADPTFGDLDGVCVAPHLFIDRQGSVHQFVRFDKRAWHAGVSSWQRRQNCNDFAVGIEMEGAINATYTLAQYDALADVVSALLHHYPGLSTDAVVGHNEIAPGRKRDPGFLFDWRGVLLGLHRQHGSDN